MNYAPLPTPDQLERLANAMSPGGRLKHVRRLTGGLDNTMDVLDVTNVDGSCRRVVLRRYGPWRTGANVLEREITALRVAARGGVPAPEALWFDEAAIFEQPTIVISYIDGEPVLQPQHSLDWADQMATALAQIHAISLTPAEQAKLWDLHDSLFLEIRESGITDRFLAHVLGQELWNLRKLALDRVELGQSTFLHRDYHPGQVLWRDGRLVGVVDWQDAAFGDPASDVAYCASDLTYCGFPEAADRFVETYRSITGRDLASLPFWNAVALGRPLPDIAQWLPAWHASGRTDLTAEVVRQRHHDLIERALKNT